MSMHPLPTRKPNRLPEYDYSQNGAYFITFCTEGKQKLLSEIVGDGVLDVPTVQLTTYGKILDELLQAVNAHYKGICLEKYIIMPNHVHFIVFINTEEIDDPCNGTSRTPSPTNATIPRLVSTLKRLTNRKIGKNIWQRSYYDHVIRDENDFLRIWNYIDGNPSKWQEDCYYLES